MIKLLMMLPFLMLFFSCTSKKEQNTIWIYTSLYKDTVAEIQPQLEKKFPAVKFQFYQAGSEEVAAKVQAENLAGQIQADVLISSDRFWYEDLASQNKLISYQPVSTEKIDLLYKHPDHKYSTLSYPLMVIAYNSDVINEKDAPKSFKDLTNVKWKDKLSSGSPLASGTTFTTVAFLIEKYGWDYFKDLRKNNIISEGGNSGVIRRLQSKERPIGIVLLENVLRLSKTDQRIKYILPSDGAVLQTNVLAIVKKNFDQANQLEIRQQVADWFFSNEGQLSIVKSFMYPTTANLQVTGAPDFNEVLKTAKPWNREFIDKTMKDREKIKEEFSKIIF